MGFGNQESRNKGEVLGEFGSSESDSETLVMAFLENGRGKRGYDRDIPNNCTNSIPWEVV